MAKNHTPQSLNNRLIFISVTSAMSPKCKEHKKGERQAVHMHYLPFGARLNKCIIMVTQLILGFSAHLIQRELFPLAPYKSILNTFVYEFC